jgi:hypothetical protein
VTSIGVLATMGTDCWLSSYHHEHPTRYLSGTAEDNEVDPENGTSWLVGAVAVPY